MKIEFIERLIQLAERTGLGELEYSENGDVVRFKLDADEASPLGSAQAISDDAATTMVQTAAQTPLPGADGQTVISSLGGVFYRAPAPGEQPFVQVGDWVEEGQTLAIIEAMKMLNPIESPAQGRVSAILIREGEMVDAGAPLFTINEEA
ncbi:MULTISPECIES: biotin/lipoyl-containing protein [unclassified Pseudomonas]|uniref:acetyl-CoA carboxylase biotin carboxyl carrier protein n=1 Tax=unclassified Pseudomonas TaxID=196821 RepID=UPI000D3678B5|nr:MULTISPECIES: biotin/lipoyl-containing protein [unclassified Pseudomonas]RAU43825.1 biotin/lipoyl-binding protein [Pseudomonas sp. RIT 409]RAU56281.1 biotin/lipoyl-binding protein [Pseudomonas sp. RIT 412]